MVATAAKTVPRPDTSRWLTRRQASDLLGVGESTLLRWERMGLLHPQYERRGDTLREHTIYDPDELARVPRRHRQAIPNAPGEQNARAFELFDQGKTVREAVIDLREVVAKVSELYEQWLDVGGAHFVVSPAARAELAKLIGPFGSIAELCERVRDLHEKIGAVTP